MQRLDMRSVFLIALSAVGGCVVVVMLTEGNGATQLQSALEARNVQSVLLMAVLLGLAVWGYHKLSKILGEKPEKFVWQLRQLLAGKPLLKRPSDEASVIAQIAYQLSTDAATGLPNYNALKHWLQEKNSHAGEVALVLVQTGRLRVLFEGECDRHDKYALHLVNYLANLLPEDAILARYSDETFAIASTFFAGPVQLSSYVHRLYQYLQHPDFLHKSAMVTAKIGAAMCSPDMRDAELLIQYAELALSNAKDGQESCVLFTPEMLHEHQQRLRMVHFLQTAIAQHEFFLVYQPQVDCNTGCVVAAEALIRWQHPQYGLIAPDRFIALAEQYHMIDKIGDWVLRTAITAAVALNMHSVVAIPVSINTSPLQLLDSQFVDKLFDYLAQRACKPEWIKLEITESTSLHDSSYLLKTMIEIAEQGIEIAIDDFGTGYSSLNYLSKYPISQIKIDRSFMMDIGIHLQRRELVRAIAGIAQIFHYEVVVEGVETEDQLQFVRDTHFNIVQGYYYYKPMPFDQLIETIAAQQLKHDSVHTLET